jgi:hypothetical protein
MENVIPTVTEKKKREQFKVIPVLEGTRERLKNRMMKVDTYDSYINKQLDKVEDLEKQLAAITQKVI